MLGCSSYLSFYSFTLFLLSFYHFLLSTHHWWTKSRRKRRKRERGVWRIDCWGQTVTKIHFSSSSRTAAVIIIKESQEIKRVKEERREKKTTEAWSRSLGHRVHLSSTSPILSQPCFISWIGCYIRWEMSWRKRNVDSVPVLFSHGHLLSSLSLSLSWSLWY